MLQLRQKIRSIRVGLCLSLVAAILLAGCSVPGVYRINIQQGNQITQEMVDQLKPGMTEKQVRFVLGTPLIVDSFHPNRWDYVYRMDKPNEALVTKQLSLFFEDGSLQRFDVQLNNEE